MRDGLDLVTMLRLLDELAAAFGKPQAEGRARKIGEVYLGALRDLPAPAVEAAVKRAIRDEKYFPRPSALRRIAKDQPGRDRGPDLSIPQGQYDAWMADIWGPDNRTARSLPCPTCGSCFTWGPRNLWIIHDRRRHREAGVPYSDSRREELRAPAAPAPTFLPSPAPASAELEPAPTSAPP